MTGLQPTDEAVEEMVQIRVGKNYLQYIPVELHDAYDLKETCVDMVVSQDQAAMTLTDIKIDSQGRFRIPAQKADIYEIEPCKPATLFIDRVSLR